ncbi:MAG: hypothetical protein IAE80_29540 [Anaerolinea sp.]|nr:hypothetical protein [Anaerolinea sp.]
MRSSARNLVIFGAIFIVLAVIVLVQQATPAVAPEDVPEWAINTTPVFAGFSKEQIAGIRLNNAATGDALTLLRGAEGVWIVPDSLGTLNVEVAEIIAQTLVILPSSSTIADTPQEYALYGFDPIPVISIEFFLNNGVTHGISIGYRNPTETGYYALIDERPEIYILERAPVDFFISVLRSPPIA